jgi:hypothetical protein
MGREVKRVALDFNWPLNKVWGGFLNPWYRFSAKCEACDGTGLSSAAKHLQDQWYGYAPFTPTERGSKPFLPTDEAIVRFAKRNCAPFGGGGVEREAERLCRLFNSEWMHHLNADDVAALIAANRLHDFTHDWAPGKGWTPKDPPYIPTPEEVNTWSLFGIGHDGINCWVVIKAECERLGLECTCPVCKGEGAIWQSPEAKQKCEEWEPTEPPAGEGYQIWETVSEGSPISPVFATPEELARHMAGTQWGADRGTSYETWLAFINGPGWSISMVAGPDGVKNGVQAAVDMAADNTKEQPQCP